MKTLTAVSQAMQDITKEIGKRRLNYAGMVEDINALVDRASAKCESRRGT